MTRSACVAAIGIGCSVAGVALAAEPPTEPSSAGPVSYSSSAGCPGEADFWHAVASHLETTPKPTPRPIGVEAVELEAGALARVTFAGADGSQDVRELTAPTCAEAVAAAALVVALALDARGDRAAKPAPAAKAHRTPSAPSRPPQPSAPALADRRAPESKEAHALALLFGGGGFLEYAVAPTPLYGVSAFLGFSGGKLWDARAGFAYSTTGSVEREAQTATFSFIGARLDGCALPIIESARFVLHPCLAAALGAVHSSGEDSALYRGASESKFWAAGGPLIRARQLFSELALEVYAGPWIPFAGTNTFVFRGPDGDLSFHEVPLVGVLAGASLAFQLP
jgi:hypothetical protein